MDASKLHARAEEAIKKKNFDYAIGLLKDSILSIYPDDTKAREMLRGCVRLKQKENGAPSSMSAQAAALVPQIKIVINKMMKKWDNVMQECENILLNSPDDKKTIYTLAVAAGNGGYIQTAISQHEACLKLDPAFKNSYSALGYLYESQDELQKSLECFQRVTQIDGTDGDASRKVKQISAKMTSGVYEANKGKHSRNLQKDDESQKDREDAEKVLRTKEDHMRAIEIEQKKMEDSEHPDRQWRRIGQLYRAIGDYKNSIEALQKASEINPLSFDITVDVGDTKIAQLESKLKKYMKAARDGDADAKAKAQAARKKLHAFQVEEFTRRVKEHPTDNDKRYELGHVLHAVGKYAEAIEHLQRGCKSPRYKIQSFNLLGECFFETGEANLAVNQYLKAMEGLEKGDPKLKPVQYNLALAYEANGDNEDAIKVFETLLEQDVNYKDVKAKLKALRS